MERTKFTDRRHAGKVLAEALQAYQGRTDLTVLALPRGGVPVAFEVASFLRAPLDVFIVRKLGYPGHEEYAMGAIASGGVRVLNPAVAGHIDPDGPAMREAVAREQRELVRREQLYRGGRPMSKVAGRCVIVVDDGLATGSSMRAAIVALRQHAPARIVVAVPVASPEACTELAALVDETTCALTPEPFSSVGQWYDDFEQTEDGEVRQLLAQADNQNTTDPRDLSDRSDPTETRIAQSLIRKTRPRPNT